MGLYEDAVSAIRWLKIKGIDEKNIILYGESLGTGVAVEIAQNRNYAGVILGTARFARSSVLFAYKLPGNL